MDEHTCDHADCNDRIAELVKNNENLQDQNTELQEAIVEIKKVVKYM